MSFQHQQVSLITFALFSQAHWVTWIDKQGLILCFTFDRDLKLDNLLLDTEGYVKVSVL
jgi:hypothetical protein